MSYILEQDTPAFKILSSLVLMAMVFLGGCFKGSFLAHVLTSIFYTANSRRRKLYPPDQIANNVEFVKIPDIGRYFKVIDYVKGQDIGLLAQKIPAQNQIFPVSQKIIAVIGGFLDIGFE